MESYESNFDFPKSQMANAFSARPGNPNPGASAFEPNLDCPAPKRQRDDRPLRFANQMCLRRRAVLDLSIVAGAGWRARRGRISSLDRPQKRHLPLYPPFVSGT